MYTTCRSIILKLSNRGIEVKLDLNYRNPQLLFICGFLDNAFEIFTKRTKNDFMFVVSIVHRVRKKLVAHLQSASKIAKTKTDADADTSSHTAAKDVAESFG